MGVLALLALVVLAPIGAVAFSRAQRARWTTAWERVARAHGLELRQNPWLHPAAATLEGEVQGRPCAIAVVVRKNVPVTARVSVAAESAAGLTLHLEREDATTWLEKRLGATEVVVGDEAFDARFCVRTDDIDGARALLDGALRASLLGAEADGLLVSPDGVVVEVRDTARGGADRFAGRVERAIEVAVDLAGRLERPSPDAARHGPRAQARGPRTGTAYPAVAKAVGPALTLALVLAVLGGIHLLRQAEARAAEARRAELGLSLEVSVLAAEVQQLALERDLRERQPVHVPSQELERLLGRTERGGAALARLRELEAAREHEAASDPARLDALRARYVALRARHPDPSAMDTTFAARVREGSAPDRREGLDRILREVTGGHLAPGRR